MFTSETRLAFRRIYLQPQTGFKKEKNPLVTHFHFERRSDKKKFGPVVNVPCQDVAVPVLGRHEGGSNDAGQMMITLFSSFFLIL